MYGLFLKRTCSEVTSNLIIQEPNNSILLNAFNGNCRS